MPVWVVENTAAGNRAYCNLNEGLGKVLRFGANSPDVLERLRWLGTEFFATMQVAVRGLADPDLKPMMAQALHMGDELHNRNAAASSLLFKRLALSLLDSELDREAVRRALTFVAGNDHFFLNISMAACKSMSDAAHGVPCSSMVTVMARNGVNFGIRLSGTGDEWFQAPANPVDGLYFPGYSRRGRGGGPRRLGDHRDQRAGRLRDGGVAGHRAIRRRHARPMPPRTAGECSRSPWEAIPAFTLPPLNFGGTPAGIDARLVADSGVLPIINTGIAHKKAGVGQIGAGITTAPMECFNDALAALAGGANSSEDVTAGEGETEASAMIQHRGRRVRRQRACDRRRARLHPRSNTRRSRARFRIWSTWSSRAGGSSSRTATARRSASSCAAPRSPQDEVDPVPVDYAVADTQGAIGYMFVKALTNELARRGLARPVVAIVTHVGRRSRRSRVRQADQADRTRSSARRRHARWRRRSAGRSWRTRGAAGVARWPSPRPRQIVETEIIRALLESGAVVVAAGGGGIPVAVQADGSLVGVEAVVDKDLASGLLAHDLGADMLLIPTGVPRVAIRFGTPEQRWLDTHHGGRGTRAHRGGRIRQGQHGAQGGGRVRFRGVHAGRGRRHRRAR